MSNLRILVALTQLHLDAIACRTGGIAPAVGGICDAMWESFSGSLGPKFNEGMRTACQSWEYYSGDSMFPVPCGDLSPEEGFDDHFNDFALWTGEQLELRISLIEHLIEHFRAPVSVPTQESVPSKE